MSLRVAKRLRGEAEANSCRITRLLHFVRNDTLCQIATPFGLAMTHQKQRFFRDLYVGVQFIEPGRMTDSDESEPLQTRHDYFTLFNIF